MALPRYETTERGSFDRFLADNGRTRDWFARLPASAKEDVRMVFKERAQGFFGLASSYNAEEQRALIDAIVGKADTPLLTELRERKDSFNAANPDAHKEAQAAFRQRGAEQEKWRRDVLLPFLQQGGKDLDWFDEVALYDPAKANHFIALANGASGRRSLPDEFEIADRELEAAKQRLAPPSEVAAPAEPTPVSAEASADSYRGGTFNLPLNDPFASGVDSFDLFVRQRRDDSQARNVTIGGAPDTLTFPVTAGADALAGQALAGNRNVDPNNILRVRELLSTAAAGDVGFWQDRLVAAGLLKEDEFTRGVWNTQTRNALAGAAISAAESDTPLIGWLNRSARGDEQDDASRLAELSEDHYREQVAALHYSLYGLPPTKKWLNGYLETGLNVFQIEARERATGEFQNSPRFHQERVSLERRLAEQFGALG